MSKIRKKVIKIAQAVISVSVNPEDIAYMTARGLSPSKLLRQRVAQIRGNIELQPAVDKQVQALQDRINRFARWMEIDSQAAESYLRWRDENVLAKKTD